MSDAYTRRLCSVCEMDIVKTFECGQCFRWNMDAQGVYHGIAMGHPALVWNEGENVMLRSQTPDSLWREYFDLERDYAAATDSLQGGEYLDECIECGRGIRILRQEPWEALCSFIISQCNNISRIKGIVERLCGAFGEEREMDGEVYYTFPPASVLAELTEDDLAPLRSGYRAQYILNAARAVRDGSPDLPTLIHTDYASAKRELLKIHGIGEKVANCVVLFGLHHMEAFPVDVWIKRALKEHFAPDFDPTSLGEYAGLAQQYIFFRARSEGRGR